MFEVSAAAVVLLQRPAEMHEVQCRWLRMCLRGSEEDHSQRSVSIMVDALEPVYLRELVTFENWRRESNLTRVRNTSATPLNMSH